MRYLAFLFVFLFPSEAYAACQSTPIPIKTNLQAETGQTVEFDYGFCWDTIASHYSVTVFHEGRPLDGFPVSYPLEGRNGVISGKGTFEVETSGRYVIRILYYSKLAPDYLSSGEVVVMAENSVAEPVGAIRGATLKLSAKSSGKRTKSWLFSVKNTSQTTATKTTLCADIGRYASFVSSSETVQFKRGKVCTDLGSIEPGVVKRARIKISYTKPTTQKAEASSANSLVSYLKKEI